MCIYNHQSIHLLIYISFINLLINWHNISVFACSPTMPFVILPKVHLIGHDSRNMTSAHTATEGLLVTYPGIQYSNLLHKEMLNLTDYGDRGASFTKPQPRRGMGYQLHINVECNYLCKPFNFNGGGAKLPLGLGHGWVIIGWVPQTRPPGLYI